MSKLSDDEYYFLVSRFPETKEMEPVNLIVLDEKRYELNWDLDQTTESEVSASFIHPAYENNHPF